jgi:hypothetical protein
MRFTNATSPDLEPIPGSCADNPASIDALTSLSYSLAYCNSNIFTTIFIMLMCSRRDQNVASEMHEALLRP